MYDDAAQKRPSGWSGYAAGGGRSVGVTVDPFLKGGHCRWRSGAVPKGVVGQ